jgi:hypothetical protein
METACQFASLTNRVAFLLHSFLAPSSLSTLYNSIKHLLKMVQRVICHHEQLAAKPAELPSCIFIMSVSPPAYSTSRDRTKNYAAANSHDRQLSSSAALESLQNSAGLENCLSHIL